jgi:ribonuclease Z
MGRKLSAYDWNLTERSWCSFKVVEVHTDHLLTTIYAGPAGFSPEAEREGPRTEMIYENRFLGVRAAICDHKIPTLAFRVDEKPGFTIDERKLQQEGVLKGNWLGLLKNAFYRDTLHKELLTVPCAGGSSCIRTVNGAELYGKIVKEENPPSVGYVTDLAFTEGNMQVLSTLLAGVDLLVCECTFLKAEADKARRSHHLCTTDFNWLLHRLKPHVVIPVHLSKSYLERSSELFREIDPPEEVSVVRLPERITPRPLLLNEIAAFTPPS